MTRPVPMRRSAAATAPSSNRASTRSVGAGFERAVAEHVRGGEVAAARRLEHLEDRMAVVEEAERRAAAVDAIDGRAELAGQQVGVVRRPRRALAERRPAGRRRARRTASARRRPGRGGSDRVVEDDDRALARSIAGVTRAGRHRLPPGTPASLPMPSALVRIEARVGRDRRCRRRAPTPAALGVSDEVERVVGRQRVGAGAHDAARRRRRRA